MDQVTISCDECRLEGTSACDDCVVTFLLLSETKQAPASAMIVDAAEVRAMRMLERAGLLPSLRFERRVG
jgi:hypothetical protein